MPWCLPWQVSHDHVPVDKPVTKNRALSEQNMRSNEENLHADVVIHVVHVPLISPPRAHRRQQQIAHLAVRVGGNDMRCTHNGGWVEEPESIRVLVGHKANAVEPMSLDASRGSCVPPVPTHPENVKFLNPVGLGQERGGEMDVDMEYRQNSSIPEWVFTCLVVVFMRKQHNVGVGPRVDRVLSAVHVICRVIDPQNLV